MPKTNPVINFIKLASPTYRAAMPALLALVLPALALQGVAWTASRPALLAQCTPLRCAPLCLRQGGSGDHWVDFDDSGDECVVSDAGSSCLEADVSAPMPIDGLDRHPHRRSPGLQNNFYDMSTADFKKPWSEGPPGGGPPPMGGPPQHAGGASIGGGGGFPFFSSGRLGPQPPPMPSRAEEMRRAGRRSPGLARDFMSMSNADFRKPYVAGGATAPEEIRFAQPPPAAQPPAAAPSPTADERMARLEAALSDMSAREETAKREAAEAKAREDELLRRLKALEDEQDGPQPEA